MEYWEMVKKYKQLSIAQRLAKLRLKHTSKFQSDNLEETRRARLIVRKNKELLNVLHTAIIYAKKARRLYSHVRTIKVPIRDCKANVDERFSSEQIYNSGCLPHKD